MKFGKWMKYVDPIVDVAIWTQEDDEEPSYIGSLLDLPWWYLNLEIGRKDEPDEEPIYISKHTNEYGVEQELIVVNLIA